MTTYHFVTILSFRNYLQDLRLTTMDLLTYVNLLDVSVLNTSDLILDASSVKEKTITYQNNILLQWTEILRHVMRNLISRNI